MFKWAYHPLIIGQQMIHYLKVILKIDVVTSAGFVINLSRKRMNPYT